MKNLILAALLPAFTSSVNAQTTAEDFYKQGERKAFASYGQDAGPAVREAAIADLSRAIELKPGYHDAYNFRGNMKLEKGDLDGAVADYTLAIEFSSATTAYYANRASALRKKGDLKAALADRKTVIKLRPKDGRGYMERGELLFELKDHKGAVADFGKGIELAPDLFVIRQKRAKAYRALGRNDLADADEKAYEEKKAAFFEKLGR